MSLVRFRSIRDFKVVYIIIPVENTNIKTFCCAVIPVKFPRAKYSFDILQSCLSFIRFGTNFSEPGKKSRKTPVKSLLKHPPVSSVRLARAHSTCVCVLKSHKWFRIDNIFSEVPFHALQLLRIHCVWRKKRVEIFSAFSHAFTSLHTDN